MRGISRELTRLWPVHPSRCTSPRSGTWGTRCGLRQVRYQPPHHCPEMLTVLSIELVRILKNDWQMRK